MARAVGVVVTFLVALVVGVFVHLDLPATRRVVLARVNPVLSSALHGRLEVQGLDRVGLRGAEGIEARMLDEDGVTVLVARGVRVRLSAIDVLRSVFVGKGDLVISIADVDVGSAEVNLDTRADGTSRLASAFRPRATSSAPGRGVRVDLGKVQAKHVWVHGRPGGAPAFDADVDDLVGSVHVAPRRTRIDLARATLVARGMPRGANPSGDVDGALDMPAAGRAFGVLVALRGAVGGVPVAGSVRFDGVHLQVVADVPRVPGALLRPMLPEAPLYDDVAAHVDVQGDLPQLTGRARATLGGASADVDGHATLGEHPSGDLHVDARALDLRAFAPDAPKSRLGGAARATFAIQPDGAYVGVADADVTHGEVSGTAIPPARVHADYRVLAAAAPQIDVHGRARIDEQGAPADVVFAYAARRATQVIDVDARAEIARLDATRFGGAAHGRARVHAIGRLRLPARSLDATADVDMDDLDDGPVRVGHAHLAVRATGDLRAPDLSTRLEASAITLAGLDFAQATVDTGGAASGMDVSVLLQGSQRAPDVDAHARVAVGDGVRLTNARIVATREKISAELRVADARMGRGELRMDGAVLDGLGEPVALAFARSRRSTHARVLSSGIDLARVAKLLRIPDAKVHGGMVAVDLDVTATDDAMSGALAIDLAHGVGYWAKDASAHLDATITGRHAEIHARAADDALGDVEVTRASLEVDGRVPLDEHAWKKAWGDVELAGQLDLAKLATVAPIPARFSIADVRGRVTFGAQLSRTAALDAAPSAHVAIATAGIAFGIGRRALAPDGTLVIEQRSRQIQGIDAKLDARFDGPTSALRVDGSLVDRRGILVTITAKSPHVPYRALRDGGADVDPLLRLPFALNVEVPRRPFGTLPLVAGRALGDVAATIAITGTALEPAVDLAAHAYGLKSSQAPITSKLDADLAAHYAAGAADATLDARTPKANVLHATAHLDAALADFFGARAVTDPPWTASAGATLTSFPLGAVAALSDRQIHGKMSGRVALEGFHADAHGKAHLEVENLEAGTTKFAKAQLDVTVEDGALTARAKLERPDAFADALANVGVVWAAALTPTVDPGKPALLTLRAKSFPLSALAPFAEPTLADLEGKLDADARIAAPADGAKPSASGYVAVRDGVVQIATLGQELHGIQARLTLSEDGVLRLTDARALGGNGSVTASAVAQLNGIRIASARMSVHIPKSGPIPIGVQGVQMGDLYGEMQIAADSSADGRVTNIVVDVPSAHVRMPEASPHDVQVLDEPKKVRVGTFRAPGQFVTLPIDGEDLNEPEEATPTPTRTNVSIRLGKDVMIERGRDLRVTLQGNPEIHVSDKVRMSGQIRLANGTLEVQGKRFQIERGTITFTGDDPGNPDVVVTAGWTAADGTRVFADFTGPLKTGKVTLRSEPGRPQDEILALILFGTADGSASTPYAQSTPDGATRAGTTAGGLAAAGLSQGLDKLTGLDVEAKVDTSDSANPRPEVELRIARDISLEVAFVLGTPPPGMNPDRTFATVDWRFLRNWSLATTFGDQGSSIADVVWRHRY